MEARFDKSNSKTGHRILRPLVTNIRIQKIQLITNSSPIIMESKKPKAHSAVLILQNPVLLWPIRECHPLEDS